MSSVKEYWKRASETNSSNFATNSSDYSSDETSDKEYCDASCNVDFDNENDRLINEDDLKVARNFDNSHHVKESRIENSNNEKSSQYVRWKVLMSLGIGLWAVLCIVDLFQSEESATRDWLYESIRGKKEIPKILLPKKPEVEIFWYSNICRYLWNILTITTSGGAYVLLFILLIVFCADPRLRKKIGNCPPMKNNVSSRIARASKNSIVAKKSFFRKKTPSLRCIRSRMPKFISVRLELVPSMYLETKIVSCQEKRVRFDLTKFEVSSNLNKKLCAGESRIVEIFGKAKENQSATGFSLNRELVDLLSVKNREIEYSTPKSIEWRSLKKIQASSSTSREDLNLNAKTFDLEIGEYIRATRKSSTNVFHDNSFRQNQKRRNIVKSRTEISNNGKTMKTRMITSSPAFKKFLLNFKQNNCLS